MDLGIDLTAATLEEFRLAQGIETSYSQMSQAQKVMLRYQYLMANTTTQQGDFQRTNLSLANSMRTLQGYIQAVQTQLGVGLGSAIRHVVVLLNNLMKYVLKAAQAFATFMQTIFGKYKGGASGIAMEGLGDAADYADDLGSAADGAASGLGDAANNAKQLKKELSVLPFDELNQLNKDREEASSGSGSGASGGGAGGLLGDGLLDWGDLLENSEAGQLPEAISAWAQRIKNAFDHEQWNTLGQIVAKGLNEGLQKVYDLFDPEKLKAKIDPWINAFTTSFNSFVKWFDFDLLGRTIGRGINNIVHILNETIEGIKWEQLGSRLADGVAGLFDEVNFTDLGNLLGNKFMILWNTLNGFVHNFPWGQLGIDIADFFNGVFEKVNFTTIADTLATGLNGVFTSLGTFTENFNWDDLVDKIAGGIITFISEFDWKGNGEKLGDFLSHLCDALIDVIDTVNWEELGQGIADFLQQLPWGKILKTVATAIITALGGLLEGMGSTPAGMLATAIINGLIAFKIGSKLIPFVNNIGKAVSGEESFSIVKLALQKLFGKGVKDAAESTVVKTAAESAGKSVVGSFKGGLAGLGTVAAEFGIVTLAVGGTVAAIYGLTRWVDKLQGGNGKITESGEALEAYIERIGESGQLSSQQVDTLWKEIEDMETAGYSTGDMIDHVRQRLDEWKVSTDSQYGALQTLNSEGTTSKNVLDEMAKSYENTGNASAQYSEDVDEAFDAVIEALYNAGENSDEFRGKYQEAIRQLTESRGEYYTTQDVINATKDILGSMGESTDVLGDDFETLASRVEEKSQAIKTSVENMTSGAGTSINNLSGFIGGFVKDTVSNVVTIDDSWKNSGSTVSTYEKDSKSALTNMSNTVKTNVASQNASLKGNQDAFSSLNTNSVKSMISMGLQTGLLAAATKKMSDSASENAATMSESFSNSYNSIKQNTMQLTEAIVQGMRQASTGIQSELANIQHMVSGLDLSGAGQQVAQSFASGFQSIRIPTPMIYIAGWNVLSFGDGGFMQYPIFGSGWYRKGGLFMGGDGQIIGIAEDGRDEAVLPLEDQRAMKRIGSAIAEAGGGGMSMSDQLVDRIADRLADIILMSKDEPDPIFNIEVKTENDEVLARAVTRGQQKLDYRNNPTPSYGY